MKAKILISLLLCSTVCSAQFGGFGGEQTGENLGSYTSIKDIDYVGDGHIGHKLDIYYPNDDLPVHNVIIHIYGSAWGSNNSKGSADLGTVGLAALKAGYIFVTPNHRTYNDALYPAQINDIKAVVRYLRGNAAELGIDDSFVGISGFSSGGHLASLMGVTRNIESTYTVEIDGDKATMDIEGNLGEYTTYSSWVDAVCDWSGPVDCRYKTCGNPIEMSPENDMVGGFTDKQRPALHALLGANTFIDPTDAPIMVAHGSADNIVPQCEGEMFFNNVKAAGIMCEYYPHSGGHGVNGDFTDEMIAFFNKINDTIPSKPFVGVSLSASERTVEPGASVTLSAKVYATDSTISKVEIFQNGTIVKTFTSEPYIFDFENIEAGAYTFKAVVTFGGGTTSTSREQTVTAKLRQSPYEGKPQTIPGRIEVEKYDDGIEGYAFHDSDNANEGGKLRTDGVDVVDGGTGFALGYTAVGEWLNYTVNVTETGKYAFSANAASGTTGAKFKLYIDGTPLTKDVSIPQTASNSWNTYKLVSGTTNADIQAGEHVLKLQISGANGNIDYLEFAIDTTPDTPPTTSVGDQQIKPLTGECEIYSTSGVKVGSVFIREGESVEQQLKKAIGRTGSFILRNAAGQSQVVVVM